MTTQQIKQEMQHIFELLCDHKDYTDSDAVRDFRRLLDKII